MVGPYSCAYRSDAQNLVDSFESKIKLIDYEVLVPQCDPINFMRDHLKLGYAYRHILDIKDFWAGCLNEYQSLENFWSRLTIDEVELYDSIDVSDLADYGSFMHPSSYKKIKDTPIMSTLPIGLFIYNMEVLMHEIINRQVGRVDSSKKEENGEHWLY